jgi:LDH2 family malate/lactate/ureidoglycolate dehydrogenase
MKKVNVADYRLEFLSHFTALGLTDEQCHVIFDHLLYAERVGKPDHGFSRLPRLKQVVAALTPGATISETSLWLCAVLLDGQGLPGYLVAQAAVSKASLLLEQHPLVAVAGVNCDSVGVLGYYSRQLALKGYVSIACCTSIARIAAPGGSVPFSGTNPLCIAVPNGETPIIYDAACSKTTVGALMAAIKNGEQIPEGLITDTNGKPTTNPADYIAGSLVAEGEHKGAGLAFMIELLAGALLNAPGSKRSKVGDFGFIFIALRSDLFLNQVTTSENINDFCARAANTPMVTLPGARSAAQLANADDEYILLKDDLLHVS